MPYSHIKKYDVFSFFWAASEYSIWRNLTLIMTTFRHNHINTADASSIAVNTTVVSNIRYFTVLCNAATSRPEFDFIWGTFGEKIGNIFKISRMSINNELLRLWRSNVIWTQTDFLLLLSKNNVIGDFDGDWTQWLAFSQKDFCGNWVKDMEECTEE